jgi:pre-60S factor REI1
MDKDHCKIAYETDDDMMEIVEFYDFTSSYPDADDDNNWVFVSDDDDAENEELPKRYSNEFFFKKNTYIYFF